MTTEMEMEMEMEMKMEMEMAMEMEMEMQQPVRNPKAAALAPRQIVLLHATKRMLKKCGF